MYIRDLFRITNFYVYDNNIKNNIVQIIFYTKDKADIILLANHFDLYYASNFDDMEVNTMQIGTHCVTINITINSFDNHFLPYFNEKLRNKYYKMVHPEFLQNPVNKPSQSDILVIPDEKMLDISSPKDYDYNDLYRYFHATKHLNTKEENELFEHMPSSIALCNDIKYICEGIVTKDRNISQDMIDTLRPKFEFIYSKIQLCMKLPNNKRRYNSHNKPATVSNTTSTPMDNSKYLPIDRLLIPYNTTQPLIITKPQ